MSVRVSQLDVEAVTRITSAISVEVDADLDDHWRISDRRVKTIARKVLRSMGYRKMTMANGMYRTAVLTPNRVFKIPTSAGSAVRMISEMEFIRRLRRNPKYRRYIAETKVIYTDIGPAFVQARAPRVGSPPRGANHGTPYSLAHQMGIGDCHGQNYGWAVENGEPYPVFFDLEFEDGVYTS